ncbi:MAG: 3-deoxy-7-phosphoheptulonate synthase [Chitinophagaceae bacterium]|nr:MAG: 3-deoxy-7-phosphoheptulonate synthase [Chitinophagaceae bacterium]
MNKIFNNLIQAHRPLIIAGPCSAENENQLMETALALKDIEGMLLFRSGVWKPRSQPGSFSGIGEKALDWLQKVKATTGLKITVEVGNAAQTEMALEKGVDVVWIGARTTVNPFYVQEIAEVLKGSNIPVLIKNPVTPDLPLWIGAVERFQKSGLDDIAVIHRGFSLSSSAPYRNAPEWHIPIELKRHFPDIPMFCDPSHISGNRKFIQKISQIAMDLGFEGLMIETHPSPENALSDADQQIKPEKLKEILSELRVSTNNMNDPLFKNNLNILRNQIDSIDHQIIELLAKRFDIVREIGDYKKLNNVTIFQLKRWQYILKDRMQKAETSGLERAFIKELLEKIHEHSIYIQTQIHQQTETP